MTVFSEVMAAEKAALEAITTAKNEMVIAIAEAQVEQERRLTQERASHQSAAVKAREEKSATITETVADLKAESDAQALALTKRFAEKHSKLVASVLRHLS